MNGSEGEPMVTVEAAAAKILAGKRLNFTEAMALYQHNDILYLAKLARFVKQSKSGSQVFFNVNRHINLTNICVSGCPLCAFACREGNATGYIMDEAQVVRLVGAAANEHPDLSEIHMVSALHPDKPFQYYLDIVKAVKRTLPAIHLKAFTPVEIIHFSAIAKISIENVLSRLKEAGLDSLPGGGAEILDDEVRRRICPNKATTQEWCEVMKIAHRLGLPTNATMLYGHIETVAQRIRHLFTIRDIQDQTNGFQAFVSFPFHPDNTALAGETARVSAWEDLKMIAIARLILDNIEHVKAFWMMLTLPVAQLSLSFGVDDLDGTVVEEKIIHAAGASTQKGITKKEIIKLVRETGYIPVERDTFYRPVKIYGKDGLGDAATETGTY